MVKTVYTVQILGDDKFELRVKNPTVPSAVVGPGNPLHGEISGSRVWAQIKETITPMGSFEIEL